MPSSVLRILVVCLISDSSVSFTFTMILCKDIFRMSEGEWKLFKRFWSSGMNFPVNYNVQFSIQLPSDGDHFMYHRPFMVFLGGIIHSSKCQLECIL